jgi:hypothetical protein
MGVAWKICTAMQRKKEVMTRSVGEYKKLAHLLINT